MFNKLLKLTMLELKVYLREPSAIFWTFFFPFLLLVIFMEIYADEENTFANTRVVVVKAKESPLSNQYIREMKTVLSYTSLPITFEQTEATDKNTNDKDDLIVVSIPSNFEQSFKDGTTTTITIDYSATPNDATYAVISIIRNMNDKFNIEHNSWKVNSQIALKPAADKASKNNITPQQYLVTGLIGMTILSTCLFGFSVVIVHLRASQAFKIYQVFPITPLWYFGSFILSRLVVIILFSVLFFAIADLFYSIEFNYSFNKIATFLVLIMLGSITFLSLGILLASRTSSVSTAMGVSNLIYFPLIFLSGLFFPVNVDIDWVNYLSSYLPLERYVTMFREVMFLDANLVNFGSTIFLMACWSIFALLISQKIFVWNNKN